MERTMKIERHSQDFVLLIDLLRKSTLCPIKTPNLASKFFIFMKQRQLSPPFSKKKTLHFLQGLKSLKLRLQGLEPWTH